MAEKSGRRAKNSGDVAERDAAPDERVRRRAYQIWEEQGWPHGREREHWLQAEREIAQAADAGPGPEPAAGEDRSRAVAPPRSRKRPGASAKLGGAPGAPATPSRGRGRKA